MGSMSKRRARPDGNRFAHTGSNSDGSDDSLKQESMALLAWLTELARRAGEDETSLQGDFVETLAPQHGETSNDWPTSSIDLHGLEVTEQPMNTIPGELRDESMKPHRWRNACEAQAGLQIAAPPVLHDRPRHAAPLD